MLPVSLDDFYVLIPSHGESHQKDRDEVQNHHTVTFMPVQ